MTIRIFNLGAQIIKSNSVCFNVWAPRCQSVSLFLEGKHKKKIEMKKSREGYFSVKAKGVSQGDLYYYLLNGETKRSDPASRYQPRGVHGPSCVVAASKFRWTDRNWRGIALEDAIFYELHIGTFTPQGTFDAAISKIPFLKKLGVTCVEIMPVAQFPGKRNWGYDGVGLFAVQNNYGGPDGLKRLVNACHKNGLAVCLDVVYNHLGPEGNYLNDFGPYFTKKYHTPWGDAVNYDGLSSKHVRRFVIENALYWVSEYHIDALRLDAVHGIFDASKKHILEDLKDAVERRAKQMRKHVLVIAESDLNDSIIIRPKKQNGYGLDAQWSDDFHHALHAILTGERRGYYSDFGKIKDLAKAIQDGFVYDGRFSKFRKKRHGNPIRDLSPRKLVVCTQNHDQVGNRARGDRLNSSISFQAQKLAAAILLLSPNTPLLFMGQEYGEKAPFQYFVSHSDSGLRRAVREGRKREFVSFGWTQVPDPNDPKTFLRSKLQWKLLKIKKHRQMLDWYRRLIVFRKRLFHSKNNRPRSMMVKYHEKRKWILVSHGFKNGSQTCVIYSLSNRKQAIALPFLKAKFGRYACFNLNSFRGETECLSSNTVSVPPFGQAVFSDFL